MGCNISYTNIGKYYVYEKIGEGGFGQVYKGMNDENKFPVAIKVINMYAIKQEKHQALKEIKLKLSKN
jgi:serine/threonine protein kinase